MIARFTVSRGSAAGMSAPGTFRPFSNVHHSVVIGQTEHRDRAKMERMTHFGSVRSLFKQVADFVQRRDWDRRMAGIHDDGLA